LDCACLRTRVIPSVRRQLPENLGAFSVALLRSHIRVAVQLIAEVDGNEIKRLARHRPIPSPVRSNGERLAGASRTPARKPPEVYVP